MLKPLSSSSERLPLSLTINLTAILDRRIGSRFLESLGVLVSVPTTILFYAIDSRLSLIRAIHFGEFLAVSLTASNPSGLVNIVNIIVVRRNRSTKGRVDSVDSKFGSEAAVKCREVFIGPIDLAGAIVLSSSSGAGLITC